MAAKTWSHPCCVQAISGHRSVSSSRGPMSVRCRIAEASGEPAPMGQKSKYTDNLLEKASMTVFARKMERFASDNQKTSSSNNPSQQKWWDLYDYNRFVEASRRVMQGRSALQQQQVVREVLLSLLPPGAPQQVSPLI